MEKVKFYDVHPGFLGAVARLPEQMKMAADKLVGKRLTLDDAVKKLDLIAKKLKGELRIIEEDKFIMFYFNDEYSRRHAYRLIRYK